jgi:cold-inducible RNA-binding protein
MRKDVMNIYVGNLPWSVDDQKLMELFGQHGEVVSARVMTDRESGRSRGFGFVEMSNSGDAQTAISNLHEAEVDGRNLRVNEARKREER